MAASFLQTLTVLKVYRLLVSREGQEGVCGYQVAKRLNINRYTTYSILERLEDRDLVHSRWETADDNRDGPPRRLYKATPDGLAHFIEALRELQMAST